MPENIFQGLNMSRAELAFSLLQRLIEVKSSEDELKNVLSVAWDALRNHESDVGLALSGINADCYRILLKILSLSLQSYTLVTSSQSRERVDSELEVANRTQKFLASTVATQVAVEIFGVVVARGFRSLTTLLHDDPSQLMPADFALLIAISRAVLHMPGIGTHIAQLLSQFADHQTVFCASALLSWSDQIPTHRDPMYAELSISFLLSLSEMPPLAEALAVEGLLTHLSSTNVISCLRQKIGMGPFDNPTRLYSIWYRGILPLALNLLTAVGAPIAPEIACTVNSFPAQLSRASTTFGSKPISSHDPTAGSITLSMALEALNLAMILKILESFRQAGPSVGVDADQIVDLLWDQSQVKDDIEHWMQRRAALRTRILPTNEKEKTWARLPPRSTTSEAENRLEEKLLEEMKAVLSLLGESDQ
jgi:nuclear pore complex protein Nup188